MLKQGHVYDEDSGGGILCFVHEVMLIGCRIDELDHISTRSLALARYKRNHDIMNAVFMHAAFGTKIPEVYRILSSDDY